MSTDNEARLISLNLEQEKVIESWAQREIGYFADSDTRAINFRLFARQILLAAQPQETAPAAFDVRAEAELLYMKIRSGAWTEMVAKEFMVEALQNAHAAGQAAPAQLEYLGRGQLELASEFCECQRQLKLARTAPAATAQLSEEQLERWNGEWYQQWLDTLRRTTWYEFLADRLNALFRQAAPASAPLLSHLPDEIEAAPLPPVAAPDAPTAGKGERCQEFHPVYGHYCRLGSGHTGMHESVTYAWASPRPSGTSAGEEGK